MNKDRKDKPYILMVREGGQGPWRMEGTAEYPSPLWEAAAARRRAGDEAKVMHGDVEVGCAPGVF